MRTAAAPRRSRDFRSAEIADLVEQSARRHDVDPLLVHSVIQVESDYNSNAVSPKGAEGLMQLMPATARMLGVSDSFDPQQNIEAGVKYLKYLQGIYKDDRLALAAYNAGPGAVEKYKRFRRIAETQNYVNQVGKRYDDGSQGGCAQGRGVQPAPSSAAVQVKSEEQHPKLEAFIDQNGRLHLRTRSKRAGRACSVCGRAVLRRGHEAGARQGDCGAFLVARRCDARRDRSDLGFPTIGRIA